jgi:hypothetical protein
MGIPLAMLIFGSRRDLSLILLPIMFYHPFQFFTNGLVANYWAKAAGGRSPSALQKKAIRTSPAPVPLRSLQHPRLQDLWGSVASLFHTAFRDTSNASCSRPPLCRSISATTR